MRGSQLGAPKQMLADHCCRLIRLLRTPAAPPKVVRSQPLPADGL